MPGWVNFTLIVVCIAGVLYGGYSLMNWAIDKMIEKIFR